MSAFGKRLRDLRESRGLLLRQAAAAIEIDQALLSKIERGQRIATKSQVKSLANFYEINEHEILTIWLGEKIAYEIRDEINAEEALKVAEEQIKYSRG